MDLLSSWVRSLRAGARSEATIAAYQSDAKALEAWLAHSGRDLTKASRGDVEGFLAELRIAGKAPATIARRYRSFVQLFKWMHEEDEIAVNPMAKIRPPRVPLDPPPVVSDGDMKVLIDTCRRNAQPRAPKSKADESEAAARRRKFEAVRDLAMILMLTSTGIRSGELMGLGVDDVNLSAETFTVVGKGSRSRIVALMPKVGVELERYLRARKRHPWAARTNALWLGDKGPLTDSGLRQLLERRCDDAQIAHINPHRFRHTFAHQAKKRGMADDALMAVAGWQSPQMLHRYGASAAAERAREAHLKLFGQDG